jgi:hypothetical protein
LIFASDKSFSLLSPFSKLEGSLKVFTLFSFTQKSGFGKKGRQIRVEIIQDPLPYIAEIEIFLVLGH